MTTQIQTYQIKLDPGPMLTVAEANAHHAQHAVSIAHAQIGTNSNETLMIIMLDCQLKVLGTTIVAMGGLSSVSVEPRQVLTPALLANAASFVLVHNHPSGDPTPSEADITMTQRIVLLAHAMGVPVHDHIIVTRNPRRYVSLAEEGLV